MSIAGGGVDCAAPRGIVGRAGACGWYIKVKTTRGGDLAVAQQGLESVLVHHVDTQGLGAFELAPGLRPRDEEVGLRAHGSRGLAAERAHELLRGLPRAALERSGEHDRLAREWSRFDGLGSRLREDRLDAAAAELV